MMLFIYLNLFQSSKPASNLKTEFHHKSQINTLSDVTSALTTCPEPCHPRRRELVRQVACSQPSIAIVAPAVDSAASQQGA